MMRIAVVALMAGISPAMGQVGSDPYTAPAKPVSEMTQAERCQNLLRLLGNSYLEPAQKAALYEKARNDGCMGQPQPQTLIIR